LGEIRTETTPLGNLKFLVDRVSPSIHRALIDFGYDVDYEYVVTKVDENLAYDCASRDIISMMSRSMLEQVGAPLGTKPRPSNKE
jgi:hypothetical protein